MVRPPLSHSSSWIPLYSLLQKSYPPCHTIGTLRTIFMSDPFLNLPMLIQCPTGCSHSIDSHWACEQISVTVSGESSLQPDWSEMIARMTPYSVKSIKGGSCKVRFWLKIKEDKENYGDQCSTMKSLLTFSGNWLTSYVAWTRGIGLRFRLC